LNYKKNAEIQNSMRLMDEKRELFEEILERKKHKLLTKLERLERSKEEAFEKIDAFFDEVIKRAVRRKDTLKHQFLAAEKTEREKLSA